MSNDDEDLTAAAGEYGHIHRAFLQALLSRQAFTFDEAKPILAAIHTAATPDRPMTPEDISQADLDDHIALLNAQLSPFDFEVRSTLHQTLRQRVYALVNTTSDALTQMATLHSPDEIAFVKRVLDTMFEKYNTPRAEVMAVTGIQALQLAKPAGAAEARRDSGNQSQAAQTGLTMSQAEKVLARLVAEGWFELSRRGFYALSPRALMELRGWLMDTYNDEARDEDEEDDDDEEEHVKIKLCQACREIVTMGQRCPDLTCQARLHDHCVAPIFRAQGGQEQCPVCKSAWADAPPVGEKAARRARTNGSNGVGSRRSMGGMDGAADEDSEASAGANG